MPIIINNSTITPIKVVKSDKLVTLTNRTGVGIIKGQKVWCNLDVVNQTKKFSVDSITSYIMCPFIHPTGDYVSSRDTYKVVGDSVTKISDRYSYENLYYSTVNPSLFGSGSYFITNGVFNTISSSKYGNYYYKGSCYGYSLSDKLLGIFNEVTVKLVKSISMPENLSYSYSVGNKIFSVQGDFYLIIDNENATYTKESLVIDNKSEYQISSITQDEKFIICSSASSSIMALNNSGGTLVLYEKVGENHYSKVDIATKFPDLLPYTQQKSTFVYNPHCKILTCAVADRTVQEYGFFKYENGTFTKLAVDLDFTDAQKKQISLITVTNDMTMACIQLSTGDEASTSYIVRLLSNAGYDALPYRRDLLNESMFTGIAQEAAEPLQQFKATCYV